MAGAVARRLHVRRAPRGPVRGADRDAARAPPRSSVGATSARWSGRSTRRSIGRCRMPGAPTRSPRWPWPRSGRWSPTGWPGSRRADGFELFADFARLLPIAVIARVLGLPDADADTLDRAKGWMEAVLAWRHSYGEDPESLRRRRRGDAPARAGPHRHRPSAARPTRGRRDQPALGARAARSPPDWGEQDVLDNAKFLFEGGSETTAFLICNAIHRLLDLPERRPDRHAAATRTAFAPVPRGGPAAHHRGPPARPAGDDGPGARRRPASGPASGSSPSMPPRTAIRRAGSGPTSSIPTGRACGATSRSTSGRGTAPVRTSRAWRRPRRSWPCGGRSRTSLRRPEHRPRRMGLRVAGLAPDHAGPRTGFAVDRPERVLDGPAWAGSVPTAQTTPPGSAVGASGYGTKT